MSIYYTTINNFMHLLETQSSLFSKQDRLELSQLIEECQSDEIEALSNAISSWCLKHPEVDDALGGLEKKPINKAPGLTEANPNTPQYYPDKRILLNAIQQSPFYNNDVEK